MSELIQALTRAADAVADYYERAARHLPPNPNAPLPLDTVDPTPEKEVKTRKPRAPKVEAATPPVPAPAAQVSTATVILTEAQSEERFKLVGEAFVQRFSKSGDAVDEVKKAIDAKFRKARLRDLVHAERVELIAHLESRIREIDAKQTQAAPAPAVGLGL